MGNQEIADFHFFSYIINLHQAGFFYPPSLSLSPPCKSNIIIHHTENARNVCCDTPYDPRRVPVYDSLGFHYRLALESAVHTSPLKRLNISPDFPMHLKEPHAAPLIGGFGGASVPSSQEVL